MEPATRFTQKKSLPIDETVNRLPSDTNTKIRAGEMWLVFGSILVGVSLAIHTAPLASAEYLRRIRVEE